MKYLGIGLTWSFSPFLCWLHPLQWLSCFFCAGAPRRLLMWLVYVRWIPLIDLAIPASDFWWYLTTVSWAFSLSRVVERVVERVVGRVTWRDVVTLCREIFFFQKEILNEIIY